MRGAGLRGSALQGSPPCPSPPQPLPAHPGGSPWNVTQSSGSVLVQCGRTCVLPGPALCLLGCDRRAPCPLSGRPGATATQPSCCFSHPAALQEDSALGSGRPPLPVFPSCPALGPFGASSGPGGDFQSCLATGPAGCQPGLGSCRPFASLVWRFRLGQTRDVFPLRPSEIGAQSSGFWDQLCSTPRCRCWRPAGRRDRPEGGCPHARPRSAQAASRVRPFL